MADGPSPPTGGINNPGLINGSSGYPCSFVSVNQARAMSIQIQRESPYETIPTPPPSLNQVP
jgi:hypothetical protein